MAIGSNYFSHDYNARTDDKIKKLIRKHGMEGYGIYWSIVEDLYQNANAMQLDCNGIAYDLRCDEKTVASIILDFGLFNINECDNILRSNSIQKRMEFRDEKSKRLSENARKRWEQKQLQSKPDAIALQTESKSNAIKGNKRKVNEKKEIQNTLPIGSCDSGESRTQIDPDLKTELSEPEKKKTNTLSGFIKPVHVVERLKTDYINLQSSFSEKEQKQVYVELKTFIEEKRPSFAEPYADLWNMYANKHGLSQLKGLTEKRIKKVQTRSKEPLFNFPSILEKIRLSPFYRGENGNWKATFDYVFESETNYLKILES